VPAAAVIPAPVAYTNIVAVKTLVVKHRVLGCQWPPCCCMKLMLGQESRVPLDDCVMSLGSETAGGSNHRQIAPMLNICRTEVSAFESPSMVIKEGIALIMGDLEVNGLSVLGHLCPTESHTYCP